MDKNEPNAPQWFEQSEHWWILPIEIRICFYGQNWVRKNRMIYVYRCILEVSKSRRKYDPCAGYQLKRWIELADDFEMD